MTCITRQLNDTPCIICKRIDQVYIGHGEVRFCAHCTISWDPIEDGLELPEHRKAIIREDGLITELPDDIVGRMQILVGKIRSTFGIQRKLEDLLKIPNQLFVDDIPEEFKAAWQPVVAGFSRVMALVHLSLRGQVEDTEVLANELFQARKQEFNDAMNDYLAQIGCGGQANLTAGPELKAISDQSKKDAKSIMDTFNLDLAKEIQNIKDITPTANANTYALRLKQWDADRSDWKYSQIALWTAMTARDSAFRSFSKNNGLTPEAVLLPSIAAEPICQGWINRGSVPFEIARKNPSPFHIGCIHFWKPTFLEGDEGDCEDLWRG